LELRLIDIHSQHETLELGNIFSLELIENSFAENEKYKKFLFSVLGKNI